MINGDGVLLSAHHREIRPPHWLRPGLSRRTDEILGESIEYLIVPPAAANSITLTDQNYWTTQSFMMFRSDFLELVLPERTQRFRVCADFYLVRMAHALNTTILVRRAGGAYCVHGANQVAHGALLSADQQPGDYERFSWVLADLAAVSAQVIGERLERFAALFGYFKISRVLLGLPRPIRPPVLRYLIRSVGVRRATFCLAAVLISRLVTGMRRSWSRCRTVIWDGY
jgi:hypothetical protein